MAEKNSHVINYVASGIVIFGGLCGVFLHAPNGRSWDGVLGYGLLTTGVGIAAVTRASNTPRGRRAVNRFDRLTGYVTKSVDIEPPEPKS